MLAVALAIMPIVVYEFEYINEIYKINKSTSTKVSSNINISKFQVCDKYFDIQVSQFCYDVPEFIYNTFPYLYDKTITYYNLLPNINYQEEQACWLNLHGYQILLSLDNFDIAKNKYMWRYTTKVPNN